MDLLREFFSKESLDWFKRGVPYLLLVLAILGLATYTSEILLPDALKFILLMPFSYGSEEAQGPGIESLFYLISYVFILLILIRALLFFSGRILGIRVRSHTYRPAQNEKVEDVRGLVALLSPPSPKLLEKHKAILEAIDEGHLLIEDIAKGKIPILKDDEEWNWQPLLTSLYLCSSEKEPLRFALLTSRGDRGSDDHYDDFEQAVRALKLNVKIKQFSGIDAMAPGEIEEGLEEGLVWLRNDEKVKDKEIAIEITSGTSAMSAIGAIFALQEGRRAIYSAAKDEKLGGKALAPIVFTPSVTFFSDLQI